MLPFAHDQFAAIFAAYNAAIWPAQLVFYLLGAVCVLMLFQSHPGYSRVIAALLAAMWLWTGLFYHGVFFARINPAAPAFAVLFIVQGFLIAYYGVLRARLRFGLQTDIAGARLAAGLGLALLAYAPLLYPLVGLLLGQRPAEMPAFGATPCPLTLFTFALLLLTREAVPRALLAAPLIWSLIGGSAAFLLQVPQDWPLLFSGLIAVPLILIRDRGPRRTAGKTG